MHKFFMERSASLWTAAFCIVAGVILVLYPVAVSNMFVTALAIGALVYGLIHLFRYIQGPTCRGRARGAGPGAA